MTDIKDDYVEDIFNMYGKTDREEEIKSEEDSLKELENAYNVNPLEIREKYISSLEKLEDLYEENDQIPNAINQRVKIVQIFEDLYNENPLEMRDKYISRLDYLELMYVRNGQISNAIIQRTKILQIFEDLYNNDQASWIKKYSMNLYKISALYKNNDQIEDAIKFGEHAIAVIKPSYKINQKKFIDYYEIFLKNIAWVYSETDIQKAIQYKKEHVSVCKFLYENELLFLETDYPVSIVGLATLFKKIKQKEKAIELEKAALNISEIICKKDPMLTRVNYHERLEEFAEYYLEINMGKEAIALLEKRLEEENKYSDVIGSYSPILEKLGSYSLKIEDFQLSKKYFKEYFKTINLYKIDSIEYFVLPFVKYYQSVLQLNEDVKELEVFATKCIDILKKQFDTTSDIPFDETFDYKINDLKEKYFEYKNSKDSIKRQKYKIFEKIFMNKDY